MTPQEIADKVKNLVRKLSFVINDGNYAAPVSYIALSKLIFELEEKYAGSDTLQELVRLKRQVTNALTTTEGDIQ